MAGNPSVGALASGAQAKARGLHTKPHSYLASPFPFAFLSFCCVICMSLCLGDNRPSGSVLSLNRVALLCHILLAGELALVTAGHGDGNGSGLPPSRPLVQYVTGPWRRLLRVPWTARRSNQSVLKEISPEYSLEGLMLKLKLQYFGHLI